jgi:hypothetical protein
MQDFKSGSLPLSLVVGQTPIKTALLRSCPRPPPSQTLEPIPLPPSMSGSRTAYQPRERVLNVERCGHTTILLCRCKDAFVQRKYKHILAVTATSHPPENHSLSLSLLSSSRCPALSLSASRLISRPSHAQSPPSTPPWAAW